MHERGEKLFVVAIGLCQTQFERDKTLYEVLAFLWFADANKY